MYIEDILRNIQLTPNESDFWRVFLRSANLGRFRADSSIGSIDLSDLFFGRRISIGEKHANGLSNWNSNIHEVTLNILNIV